MTCKVEVDSHLELFLVLKEEPQEASNAEDECFTVDFCQG
jgi:hypothetical protein